MADSDIHTASLSDRFLRVFKKLIKRYVFICILFYLRRWILTDKIYNSDLVFISVRPKFRLLES